MQPNVWMKKGQMSVCESSTNKNNTDIIWYHNANRQ